MAQTPTLQVSFKGVEKLEKILEINRSEILESIREAVRESLTIATAKEPPWSAEFTRYAPAQMTAAELMGVIADYGLTNDTLDSDQDYVNRQSWKIRIRIEKE